MNTVGPKKSLFNRPAWAAKESSSNTKDNAVFGRHQVFDEVLELEDRKRLRREAKAKQKAEKNKLEEQDGENSIEAEESEKKRRRISKNPPDVDSDAQSSSSRSSSSHKRRSSKRKSEDRPQRVTRSTPKKDKSLQGPIAQSPSLNKTSEAPPSSIVIELGDEDSDDVEPNVDHAAQPTYPSSTKKPAPFDVKVSMEKSMPEPESEESEDDEYMRALKKRAREKAQLQRLNPAQQKSATAASPASDFRSPSVEQPPTASGEATKTFDEPEPEAKSDPEIAILIKSLIPNAKPLIVNRRVSQPLQQVKEFWCGRQNFEPAFTKKVFFTFLDIKLFNSSTLRTALQMLKKQKGFDPDGSEEPSKGKIILEAMTEEIYQERLKSKERKLAAEANSENVLEAEEADEAPAPEPPKKEGIIIRLKCKELPIMPLRIRPHTSIEKIMRGFQSQNKIDPQKTCYLVFDGERLPPEMSVEEAGFQDDDEIEVHPR